MAYQKSRRMILEISEQRGIDIEKDREIYQTTFENKKKITNAPVKTLHIEKQKKPITELTIPPPKIWSDVKGLLYDRCVELNNICTKILGKNKYKLYLFGSQVSGFSRSNYPDIDIWCLYPDGTLEQKIEIIKRCNFKLDFVFVDEVRKSKGCIRLFK